MTVTLILQNRIDFCGIIVAERCNPNGDPVDGNVPRHDFPGYGIISDVCLKRKIRDRLHDAGHEIFVIWQDRLPDGIKSLNDMVKSVPELREAQKSKNEKEFVRIACEKWLDVRAFGQVFAFKAGENVSTHARGPVSLCEARTIEPVDRVFRSLHLEAADGYPYYTAELENLPGLEPEIIEGW